MRLRVKYIVKDSKTDILFYRRVFPPRLRPHVARIRGKSTTELKFSLEARSLDDPVAKERHAAADREYSALAAQAERMATGTFDRLDSPRMAYLGKLFEADWLTGEDTKRREGLEGFAERLESGWEWLLDDFKRWYAEGDTEAAVEHWGASANRLLQREGLVIDPSDDAQFASLCMELNEAALRVSEVSLERLRGKPIPSPAPPERPEGGTRSSVAALPLFQTFESYAAAQGISAGVRYEWGRYIKHLVDFLGHDNARKVTREDVVRWRDHLLTTPTRTGEARKAVTVKDKYITALRCTLGWAVDEKKLTVNVAADVKVRVPRRVKTRATPDFTMDEAGAVLRATLEVPKGRLSAPYVRARRWIPWLCAYSGARVNEISQLRKEDVRQMDGVWVIEITPEAGTVKTDEARLVPLHAHVIEQGFLEMVERLPEGPIFYDPAKQRVKSEGNRHFKKVGEKLAKWVREEVGLTDPALQPNHAWRHLFKTLAADAGIEEKVADALQGHAASSQGRKYGQVSIKARAAAMAKFPAFRIG